jgi:uncharacterized membrane protein
VSESTVPPPVVESAVRLLATLVAAGVLLQSVWAGGFLRAFYSPAGELGSSLVWHEIGANATFGLLLVEGLLVLATPLRRRRALVVSGLVLGVLLTGVIGLGYVGGGSVVVHVPLGVATFGLALVHVGIARGTDLRTGTVTAQR